MTQAIPHRHLISWHTNTTSKPPLIQHDGCWEPGDSQNEVDKNACSSKDAKTSDGRDVTDITGIKRCSGCETRNHHGQSGVPQSVTYYFFQNTIVLFSFSQVPNFAVYKKIVSPYAYHHNESDHVHIRKKLNFENKCVHKISHFNSPEHG